MKLLVFSSFQVRRKRLLALEAQVHIALVVTVDYSVHFSKARQQFWALHFVSDLLAVDRLDIKPPFSRGENK